MFQPLDLKQGTGLGAYVLQPLPNPAYRESQATRDPFSRNLDRDMVAAQGDPFLFALMSGNNEGRLTPANRHNGIVTFGVPVLSATRDSAARSELLRSIHSGLGGSLRNFMADVFDSDKDLLDLTEDGSLAEENPFSRAIESLREGLPTETASKVETRTEQPPNKESKPPTPPAGSEATTKLTVGSGGGSVTTVRPYVMLKMEANGDYRALPVSQPGQGVYESVEFGLAGFNVFPFTDVAEFPMSMAVADFNRDSLPDVALHVPNQGLLRFFFSGAGGEFEEGMRIQASRSPSSVAVGDFNGDGWPDLALSSIGTGTLTLLYGGDSSPYRQYKVYWLDVYRDYVSAEDDPEAGTSEVLGMNFTNRASVLVECSSSLEKISGKKIEFLRSQDSEVSSPGRNPARLNATATRSSLSVSFENRMRQMVNVVNVRAGSNLYVLVGDLDSNGSIDLGLALPLR